MILRQQKAKYNDSKGVSEGERLKDATESEEQRAERLRRRRENYQNRRQLQGEEQCIERLRRRRENDQNNRQLEKRE